MRAILIENKQELRQVKSIISHYCPEIELVGSVNSISKASKLIKEQKPSIVFLNISNHSKDDIKLVDDLYEINFYLVFLTTVDCYINDYLRLSGINLLYKPICPNELKICLNFTNISFEEIRFRFRILNENLIGSNPRLIIDGNEGVFCLNIQEIRFIEAEKGQSIFHLSNAKELISYRNLAFYENTLSNYSFVRTHRSKIINSKFYT